MNKISISSILSIPEEEIIDKNGLMSDSRKNKKTIKSEVDDLIQSRKQCRESKIKMYRNSLRNCIKKVNHMNKEGSIETFYKIERLVFGHPEYDFEECTEYVMMELQKMYFDVAKIEDDIIFVSWKYIEYNRDSHSAGNSTDDI